MENNWQDILVMTSENIHLFPGEYQDFFTQLEKKGTSNLFPERKRLQSAQNQERYQVQLRNFVLEALEVNPNATVLDVLRITLPKLPREVAPAYLTDLVHCAQTMLSEREVAA